MPCSEAAGGRRQAPDRRGEAVDIGLLDTGVDGSHPLLVGRVATFRMVDPSGFGSVSMPPRDTGSHGTFTAGLLVGCAGIGIAPAARLHVAAVIEEGAVVARILLGLDWLCDRKPGVVCLSLGVPAGPAVFAPLIDALVARDVLLVAAVGNGGAGSAHAPASDPRVLAVGATSGDAGTVAAFSGSLVEPLTGACTTPDVTAPGCDVRSLAPGGGTRRQSGASVSAALVAGYCARLRQLHPERTAAEIADAVRLTARAPRPDQAHRTRFGAADLPAASALLAGGCPVRTDPRPAPDLPRGDDPLARRLLDRLRHTDSEDCADAVVVFRTMAARDRRVAALRTAAAALPEFRVTALKHAPIIVLRARARVIGELTVAEDVVFRGATDIDRAWFHARSGVRRAGQGAAALA